MRIIEPIRVAARAFLPNAIYRHSSSVTNHVAAIGLLGLQNYRQLFFSPEDEVASIRIQDREFHFRPGTPDRDAIIQNLARLEWLQTPLKTAQYIIDGGAYIGDSTFAFLLKYPKAKIICIEPNAQTHPILRRNLQAIAGDTTLICGGLACESKTVTFGGEFLCASIQTDDSDIGERIECFSINDLIKQTGMPYLDIVKLDIEGAEKEVLTENNSWLNKTQRVLVEFHGDEIEEACTKELLKFGFSHFRFRSVHYFDRPNPRSIG
jgi:FkbM family methyltransferase